METLPLLDLIVLVGYLAGTVGVGFWFMRRAGSSEHFMAAGRSLPGWAIGLSIFGSYVSSISFLANPGKAYASNWGPFVFALSLPLAAWLAVRYFVPFYRESGEVSAYHHLEHRFGAWARTYAVVCFLLIQLARLGTILYLLALALQPLIGVDLLWLIVLLGVLITVYPLLGGTEAVIWTGVIQSLVLVAGPLVCIAVLLLRMPGGPSQLLEIAHANDKFSLGSLALDLTDATFWVVLAYGLVTHLQNFGIDQGYVQRYITARTDRDAARSIWIGALLYIPLAAGFFFIGTALFAYYRVQPELLPPGTPADAVFPHFIRTELPPGLTGLVLAAVCAAAMDSNLNSIATLFLCDIYRRYFRPEAAERESMWILRSSTFAFGALGTVVALAMTRVASALDAWWELAGIFSGGMLGLFLLGQIARHARRPAAITGVVIGVLVIVWMTVSPTWTGRLAPFRSPFHHLMILVIGTLVILLVGLLVTRLTARGEAACRTQTGSRNSELP